MLCSVSLLNTNWWISKWRKERVHEQERENHTQLAHFYRALIYIVRVWCTLYARGNRENKTATSAESSDIWCNFLSFTDICLLTSTCCSSVALYRFQSILMQIGFDEVTFSFRLFTPVKLSSALHRWKIDNYQPYEFSRPRVRCSAYGSNWHADARTHFYYVNWWLKQKEFGIAYVLQQFNRT